jgi:hypothetical protein
MGLNGRMWGRGIIRFGHFSDDVGTDFAGIGAGLEKPPTEGANVTFWECRVGGNMVKVLYDVVDYSTTFPVPLGTTSFYTFICKPKFLFGPDIILINRVDEVFINRQRFRQDTYSPILLPDAQ